MAKKGNRYGQFNVRDVRNELGRNEMLPPLPSQLKKLPIVGGIGGLPGVEGARKPTRLAPLDSRPILPTGGSSLPPLAPTRPTANGLSGITRMGQMPPVR